MLLSVLIPQRNAYGCLMGDMLDFRYDCILLGNMIFPVKQQIRLARARLGVFAVAGEAMDFVSSTQCGHKTASIEMCVVLAWGGSRLPTYSSA